MPSPRGGRANPRRPRAPHRHAAHLNNIAGESDGSAGKSTPTRSDPAGYPRPGRSESHPPGTLVQLAVDAVTSATSSIERAGESAQDSLARLLIDRSLKGLAAITDDLSFLHELEWPPHSPG